MDEKTIINLIPYLTSETIAAIVVDLEQEKRKATAAGIYMLARDTHFLFHDGLERRVGIDKAAELMRSAVTP